MTVFAGIDLGTTNSAISTFDGENVRTYKSPEQNDVTPSVLFWAKRGGLIVGQRAYENAARTPASAASLFKRIMGTNTPVRVETSEGTKELTPEECSAEVLRALFAYLPEEVRATGDVATIITIPAAFNSMQRDATMAAARAAGIGRVRLLQEPVAAVMSVMRNGNQNGTFIVFDLGGGTLDITIAESHNGRVSVQRNGGAQMLGGRDFDRLLVDNVVKPWLVETFDIPEDFASDPKYMPLLRVASWAAEKAKIELSSREEASISLDETQTNLRDESGQEIYVHIPVTRVQLDALIAGRLTEAIEETRKTLEEAHLTFDQIERIVFVGGPTNYAPLREKVSSELGIRGSTEVNPMTAVSEGAAIYAESADWNDSDSATSQEPVPAAAGGVSVRFEERTPTDSALVITLFDDTSAKHFVVFDNLDDGWTSGRIESQGTLEFTLDLKIKGANHFRVKVYVDGNQSPIHESDFEIRRSSSVVESIPASHRVGVQVMDSDKRSRLANLVEAGEALPKNGSQTFYSRRTITAGEPVSLTLALWEGEIDDPVTDNRPIGVLRISGTDFAEGTINEGDALICEYEIKDSGEISLNVVVPSIQGVFNSFGRNLYSRTENQINFEDAHLIVAERLESIASRIQALNDVIQNPELAQALDRLQMAKDGIIPGDAESIQQAEETDLQAKRTLGAVSKKNKTVMNRLKHAEASQEYAAEHEAHATNTQKELVNDLFGVLRHDLDTDSDDFDDHLGHLKEIFKEIWFSQPKNLKGNFEWLASRPHLFNDRDDFEKLVADVRAAIKKNDDSALRRSLYALHQARIDYDSADERTFIDQANISL
jgi:molecular chaperone DnaK